MHRLLIVDDEMLIVDGLFDLFQSVTDVELETFRAYSSSQALEIVSQHKIDLVFTDIRMPGKSGLELQQEIVRRWPNAKVIFLTGYNDFDYAQQAIRGGGFDFILKTEGEERILETFYQAIRDISFQMEEEELLSKAKRQMQLALPTLQKDYLLFMMEDGKTAKAETRKHRFDELEIPLRADRPVKQIVCRVDEWFEEMNHYEKALLVYAIQNIAEELMHDACLFGFSYHPNQLLWFVQPKLADSERDWQDLNGTLRDSVGSIQAVSKNLLKLPVSLFLSSGYVSWEEAGSQFIKLKALQGRGIGQNKEIVLFDAAAPEKDGSVDHDRIQKSVRLQKRIKLLETYLESGQNEKFELLYLDLSADAKSLSPYSLRQLHHAVAAMLLGYMNACGMIEDVASKMDLERMLEDSSRVTWEDKNADLLQLAHYIFEQKSKEQTNKSFETVEQLKEFIQEELDKELSLTRLSEVVHMNTSYLSRFFKQMTGRNLTEYIMDLRIAKAKTLLRETDLKIQDIAGKVGFDAPAYFIRLFKKETNLTPMEYRESRVNGQN